MHAPSHKNQNENSNPNLPEERIELMGPEISYKHVARCQSQMVEQQDRVDDFLSDNNGRHNFKYASVQLNNVNTSQCDN